MVVLSYRKNIQVFAKNKSRTDRYIKRKVEKENIYICFENHSDRFWASELPITTIPIQSNFTVHCPVILISKYVSSLLSARAEFYQPG